MSAPVAFAAAIGGHPLVADVLWTRGHRDIAAAQAFLDPARYTPSPPSELPGMAEAVERLRTAIARGERIRVWGDFDVDGQTSTSALLIGLRALGANADFTIPNRVTHSHGLNRDGLLQAREDGARVILTCDCGVTDFSEIEYAAGLGLEIIITDHHDLARDSAGAPRLPPQAAAVVNPKRLPAGHPLIHLPGVGVACKLIEALAGAINPAWDAGALLDLAALGIVADVAHLAGDTRHLLQRGLQRIRESARPGLRALLRTAGLQAAHVTADEIGFQLGPRLNAAGRLATAELSVQLLVTESDEEAGRLAAEIERLNTSRRELQHFVEESAERLLAQHPEWLEDAALIMASPDWHPSVLGVVASGFAERLNRPAMLIAGDENGPPAMVRGSARSAAGIDINAAIQAQSHLLSASGGHPLAAGFAIPTAHIAAFRAGVDAWLRAAAGRAEPGPPPPPEAFPIALAETHLALCAEIERLAPFGPGNERPVLRSAPVEVARIELLGRDGRHQRLWLRDVAGEVREVVWWRSAGQSAIEGPCVAYYTLRRNVYRGQERAQLQLERLADEATEPAAVSITARHTVVDIRAAPDRAAAVTAALEQAGQDNAFVFGAGPGQEGLPRAATPRPVLIVVDAPPGLAEWERLLAAVAPQRVLLAMGPPDPRLDSPDHVVRQTRGLLETARLRGDSVDDARVLARMALRINQRIDTVRAAIDVALARDPAAGERLAYLLEETRAFRRFLRQAPASAL